MLTRYTPHNRAELLACLIGLGDNRLVEVRPAAAEMLPANGRRTVKDLLDLPACDRAPAFDRGEIDRV